MALRTRIQPIEREIRLLIPELSPEGRSKALASYARGALADAQDHNRSVLGRTPAHETFVDNRRSDNIDGVRPDGVIVFEFELYHEMFAWIAERLEEHSPVGREADRRPGHPGLYKRSHIMVADGRIVTPDTPLPPTVSEVFFANTVPYSRKIERGLSSQAPTGVYEVVAILAHNRFGNLARIKFGFRSLIVGGINEWAQTTALTARGRQMNSRSRDEWLRRQPAVIVRLR